MVLLQEHGVANKGKQMTYNVAHANATLKMMTNYSAAHAGQTSIDK